MSKRNREKRAAKQRARQRRTPTSPRGGSGGDQAHSSATPPPPSAEALASTVLDAAYAHSKGEESAAPYCAEELGHGRVDRRTAGAAVGIAMQYVIGHLWQGGWLPADLWQIARRRAGTRATSLMVDAIAADAAQYAPATVHERWSGQLRQLDATVWWDRARPHFGQWADHHGIALEQALVVAVTLLAELISLPTLPRILPLPGGATHGHTSAGRGIDEKTLARVRGLLAKAESTEFPDEAEALSAKAQELMNRHAFERALLEASEQKPQTANSIRLWLDSPYVDAKAQLVSTIAEANRCRAVFHSTFGFVSLIGADLDLEITELLVTSLLIQATKAMVAEGSRTTRDGKSRSRSFRQSFLVSYAVRIGERLRDANAAQAEDPRLLPVLADRSRAVDETFEAMFSTTVEKTVSVSNEGGWRAGRAAADRADLTIDRTAVESRS